MWIFHHIERFSFRYLLDEFRRIRYVVQKTEEAHAGTLIFIH
ncbi:hypothetical protein GRAN_3268 [Granulicella sibirica]|uniref:Uncharacterized protein n=1 Tax=Granulicella sibirica TaxID=2479048 RepID=A0A4Q0T4B0_9BACT|nr:hypothetical protein GRAN_3268 [Granulicella sibirica]